MKNSHLTDEQLQAYLLKQLQDDRIDEHLHTCTLCKEKLEQYEFLIHHLEETTTEAFSFDVSAVAMDAIVLYEQQKSKQQTVVFWGILVVIFVAISAFAIPFIPQLGRIFQSTSLFTTLFAIGSGLLILLILVADLFKHYKKKEQELFAAHLQPIQ